MSCGSGLAASFAPGETLRYPVTSRLRGDKWAFSISLPDNLFPCVDFLLYNETGSLDGWMSGYTAQMYNSDWFISLINIMMRCVFCSLDEQRTGTGPGLFLILLVSLLSHLLCLW